MAWDNGNSTEMLWDALEAFIKNWFAVTTYKNRLPRQHIHILKQGAKQSTGVKVVLVTERDPANSRVFDDAGGKALEESHLIALVVKADKSADGVLSVTKTHSVLKMLFLASNNSDEQTDLLSRGVFNVFETSDGLLVDPGAENEEGSTYSQQLNLTCTTDTLM